ncbi:MAG: hypothetical protein PHQ98_00950 [Candidatus ainarchaeum sp.]|nr:hypothetical protein [Candidatus ainarchaeum sp.]
MGTRVSRSKPITNPERPHKELWLYLNVSKRKPITNPERLLGPKKEPRALLNGVLGEELLSSNQVDKKRKLLPLRFTDRERAQHFDSRYGNHHKSKKGQVTVPIANIIFEKTLKKAGMNLKIPKRISKGIDKLEAQGIRRKLPLKNIRLRQALFLDKLAAESADYFIERLKSLELLYDMAKLEKINVEKLNPIQIEKEFWEKEFNRIIRLFEKRHPAGPEILRIRRLISLFTRVPNRIHEERARHWKSISRIEKHIKEGELNPDKNLSDEINNMLKGQYQPNSKLSRDSYVRNKVIDISMAASIYADLMTEHKGKFIYNPNERERMWDHMYSEAMEKIYQQISEREDLVKGVIKYSIGRE